MIVDRLESTLNGGYGGLYGEVVTEDIYHIRRIRFVPDIIFDLGANVGIFTRYARELFPNAIIVSVEPDPENFEHLLKFTNIDEKMILVNKAIGKGNIYKCLGAANGSGEVYVSDGPGYPEKDLVGDPALVKTKIESIMFYDLVKKYWKLGMKGMLKLDCEGNETVLFNDIMSMTAITQMTYISGELHNYAMHGGLTETVKGVTAHAFRILSNTHDIVFDHINFYATKKLVMDINFRDEFGGLLERLGLKGDAVEIGVAEGRNARVLISQPAIEKLYLIDNWEHLHQLGDGGHPQSWHENNYKETQERVEPWKEKAVLLKGKSADMIKKIPDDSLIFAYIDCDHSEKGFTNDLLGILPKVKVGGVVAGHDVLNPSYGVGNALKKWIDDNGYTREDVRFTVEDGDNSMVSFWFIKK